jgi:predicted regulator of Ras-like GTPase activity (Roadblock/LC7/MglB family)
MSDDVPGRDGDPGLLLAGLTGRVPGIRGALLLSADGLAIAGHGLGADAADHLAALAAGMFSHARQAAVRSGGRDGVRQVVVDADGIRLFAVSAGTAAVVTVLADCETDTAALGDEMREVIADMQPFLAAQPRMRGTVIRSAGKAGGPPGRR